ncbi:MAG: 16S rRNA (cytidine(1402)-2'-O)-methyltransferase [Phascolarctobacterium sp.]|uniref:16S rRNA (cytidine(1402)-2'-O)-methyltransferase n=1 Tax=Phascolarctobacterium sp. TaxID=2049039 RepID=UPI0026DC31FF|nr:16S rRNA (cytidine(1402)-2'-O)-methyltransferase [Phascolarctobacterium sp.]MDO4922173.1 16S rRNA (cytidine(1402)-2'-O)-methyltransferase [Phascolarctobacterium sp.]
MTAEEITYGTLYLCATPIGNLEDMTPRALRMLREADLIAAEDTRHTLQLLNHFGIKGRLVRYDEHSKEKQGAYLLEQLLAGKNIALVSDAGFPGIADPGEALAKDAIAAGVRVVPVPGANAALCALIASGLPAYPFFFGGFLPKSKRNRREQLEAWKYIPATMLLYEAPHRIEEVLKDILEAWGDRPLAAARELTKLHEEFYRGTVSGCLAWLEQQGPRGEFCLVVGPGDGEQPKDEEELAPLDEVRRLLAEGMDKKFALAQVAKKRKIPRRELYNQFILEGEGISK